LLSACAGGPQTRVWGNLNHISPGQTVAILPIEVLDADHQEVADHFRKNLYANLRQSHLTLLEPYVVDALLEQHRVVDPARLRQLSPLQLGEILGVDALVFSRINKVNRSYMVLHSSMEVGASVKMVDTRTGETLWAAKRTESDFSGLAKIPTGMSSVLLAPIAFILNEAHLKEMTTAMAGAMTSALSAPVNALRSIPRAMVTPFSGSKRDNGHGATSEPMSSAPADSPALVEEARVVAPQRADPPPAPREIPPLLTADSFPPPTRAQRKPEKKSNQARQNPSYYTVQVGSYKTQNAAKKLLTSLVAKGYDAVIQVAHRGERLLYRVHVNRHDNREEAVVVAQRLAIKEHLKNIIVHIDG
jgi:hypothetical protein